jgi:DNA-binding NtrC family response regulator
VDRLLSYPWPGNIRELEATVSRAALASQGSTIHADDVQFLHPGVVRVEVPPPTDVLRPLREVEREHIQRVLDATNWNKKRSARVLEIGRETLYRKIDEFNLVPLAQRQAGASPVLQGVFGGQSPDAAAEPGR